MSEPNRSPWADPAGQPADQPADQPSHGQPSHSEPSHSEPSYGQPPYGQPPYGKSPYGEATGPPAYQAQYGPPGGLPPAPAEVPGLGHPGRRLVARLIDTSVATIGTVVCASLLAAATANADGDLPAATIVAMFVIILGGIWAYEAVQLAVWGRTLGKRAMKLRVAPRNDINAPLTSGRGLGRGACYPTFFMFISVLPLIGLVGTLNVLWHLWDRPLRQCLHDKMAGTVVVDARVRP